MDQDYYWIIGIAVAVTIMAIIYQEMDMFDFFIGVLAGAVIMDLLWAWRTGTIETICRYIDMKIKLIKARKL